jgi:hypothetical protein
MLVDPDECAVDEDIFEIWEISKAVIGAADRASAQKRTTPISRAKLNRGRPMAPASQDS